MEPSDKGIVLNEIEVRVLGSLMEKSMTTPEYYPMSLNALTNACNQKTNRHPILSLDKMTVARALEGLKEKQLVTQSDFERVPKYAETFVGPSKLIPAESALLMVLFLRGPQTIGDLRGRTERAYRFDGLQAVESALDDLIEAGYVRMLPRMPGQKESRYAHLLAGEPQGQSDWAQRPEPETIEVRAENERIAAIEGELSELRGELADLRADFEKFRDEFK